MQTLEKSITNKVRCEVESSVTTVETTVHTAIVSGMDNLVIPRMEIAMRLADFSSTRNPSSVVLDPDHRNFFRRYYLSTNDGFW